MYRVSHNRVQFLKRIKTKKWLSNEYIDGIVNNFDIPKKTTKRPPAVRGKYADEDSKWLSNNDLDELIDNAPTIQDIENLNLKMFRVLCASDDGRGTLGSLKEGRLTDWHWHMGRGRRGQAVSLPSH